MSFRSQNAQNPLDEHHRYEVLLEMTDLVVRHHSLPELFTDIATRLRRVADFQLLNFSLHDTQHDSMHLHWWEGPHPMELPSKVAITESPSGWVLENQKELLFSDVERETRFPAVLALLRGHG